MKWEDLGPAQRAGFAEEAKKGKAGAVYESVSTMANEGMEFSFSSGSRSGKIEDVAAVKTTQQMLASPSVMQFLGALYPALTVVAPVTDYAARPASPNERGAIAAGAA